MPETSEERLSHELGRLATAAGFREQGTPEFGLQALHKLRFWTSDFAILALLPVAQTEGGYLEQAFRDSSEWVSIALKAKEKKGWLIDGYLILALPSKPDQTLLAVVRGIESDTTVCRKHVVWPDDDRTWSNTLYGVTVLGLPSATAPSSALIEPDLPFAARRALEEREDGASFSDIAFVIEELLEEGPEETEHVN